MDSKKIPNESPKAQNTAQGTKRSGKSVVAQQIDSNRYVINSSASSKKPFSLKDIGKAILIGLFIMFCGLGLTVESYSATQPGSYYISFIGLMAIGTVIVLSGIYELLKRFLNHITGNKLIGYDWLNLGVGGAALIIIGIFTNGLLVATPQIPGVFVGIGVIAIVIHVFLWLNKSYSKNRF